MRREYLLYLLLLPAVAVRITFAYLPMFSNVIAFMDYDFSAGWMGLASPLVGLKHFRAIFTNPYFFELIYRTLYYSLVILLTTFPPPFILAVLISQVRNNAFKRTVQTISYLPHFISWVTLASLIYIFLSTSSTGLVNHIKVGLFGGERILFMKYPAYFPAILSASSIIKETGWGAIIYLAAIVAIDPQLYEAATIDGAGRWKQFLYVTFPCLLPTTIILLIFRFGALFGSDFDQIFNLQNPLIRLSTNTINVYTYYYGIQSQQYSIATAIGLFQGLVNCVLLLGANYLSRWITEYGFF